MKLSSKLIASAMIAGLIGGSVAVTSAQADNHKGKAKKGKSECAGKKGKGGCKDMEAPKADNAEGTGHMDPAAAATPAPDKH